MNNITAASLFSGAGGMDIGFTRAGFDVVFANELEKTFASTYEAYFGKGTIVQGDICDHMDDLRELGHVDVVFGGPPCQGFSVAGKMDPEDPRSKMVWRYLDAVEILQPKVFVMENVRALGKLKKWEPIRSEFIKKAEELGYKVFYNVLNAVEYGVPQKRERVFFVGVKGLETSSDEFMSALAAHKKTPQTIREVFSQYDRIGTGNNPDTCTAFVTLAAKPVMRKSPYAGMLLNGQGRPMNLDGYSQTLAASMGGNKTPVIDQVALDNPDEPNWIERYHKKIVDGDIEPEFAWAPDRLRRLSITEAAALQTFPDNYPFQGNNGKIYCQIGNAVPCNLAEAVATTVKELYFT